jgi:hypothetical protein
MRVRRLLCCLSRQYLRCVDDEGPVMNALFRFDDDGADNIYTTNSSKNNRVPTIPVVNSCERNHGKKCCVIIRFVDRLELIPGWIKKEIDRFRKWLDELDRHIVMIPYPGCS